MISTLFAHEFRITRKTLFSTVGIVLLVAAVSFALAVLRLPVVSEFCFAIGVIAVAIITPLVMGLLAESYWRTMYGREGYFTMVLPVRGRALFTVKVLYGVSVTIAAVVLTLVGVAGALVAFAISQGTSVRLAFEGIWNTIGTFDPFLVWFLIACIVLQLAFTVISGAALMSIGAEARFNHLGFGAPVLGAIVLYVVMQVLGLAAMLFIPFGLKIAGPNAGSLVAEGMWGDFSDIVTGAVPADSDPSVIGLGIVVVSVVVAVLFAWRGARSVERHTSLR